MSLYTLQPGAVVARDAALSTLTVSCAGAKEPCVIPTVLCWTPKDVPAVGAAVDVVFAANATQPIGVRRATPRGDEAAETRLVTEEVLRATRRIVMALPEGSLRRDVHDGVRVMAAALASKLYIPKDAPVLVDPVRQLRALLSALENLWVHLPNRRNWTFQQGYNLAKDAAWALAIPLLKSTSPSTPPPEPAKVCS